MILPIAACIVIVLTLGWFGLHVLERGVIFVDLALAQVAALGTTYAVFLGHEPDSSTAFALALTFTFIGAAAFSAARIYEEQVPQEAIIGIAYAVSAAAGMLMIHFADDAHGGEKLEHLLVGNLVWVQPAELAVLAGACAAVGLLHLVVRKKFLAISYRTEGVPNVALWDLLFYGSFGVALTAIVSVSGVLLVFSYLVIPAVIARLLVRGVLPRLLVAWATGLVVSVAGVAVSYTHPTGPVIVAFFGIVLLVVLVYWAVRHAQAPHKALLQAAGAVALVAGTLGAFGALPVAAHAHHDHDEEPAVVTGSGLGSPDSGARDAAARVTTDAEALAGALAKESDESVRLTLAVALVRRGDRRGLDGLADLTTSETPFLRMEADSRLRTLAGGDAPPYDPLSGPDVRGAWKAWAGQQRGVPPGLVELP
ncbi:MAG: metal ABC transporter permease [Pseudomonadota bacterium]|nr:metal ABC transporter permease [Pseudomonadota bacterium]